MHAARKKPGGSTGRSSFIFRMRGELYIHTSIRCCRACVCAALHFQFLLSVHNYVNCALVGILGESHVCVFVCVCVYVPSLFDMCFDILFLSQVITITRLKVLIILFVSQCVGVGGVPRMLNCVSGETVL